MDKIKDKIRKLLSLSKSSNKNEAQSAMLKAKELMAKHKLKEEDVIEFTDNRKVKEMLTGITFSSQRDQWINYLKDVIAENYCCRTFVDCVKPRTYAVGFVGMEEDIDICVQIFEYAVDCIHSGQRLIKNSIGRDSYYDIRETLTGYGIGFVEGIYNAFEMQKKEKQQEWGLVMTVPSEVDSSMSDFERINIRHNPKITKTGYEMGIEDGEKFITEERITEKAM